LLEALQYSTGYWLLTTTLLGLVVGSFLNVVIYRVPIMMRREWESQCAEMSGGEAVTTPAFNLFTPNSRCPKCGHAIRAWENIPIVSYLIQRGRCAHCGEGISPRYPLIEGLSAIMTAVVAWHFGFGAPALAAMALTWALIALTMIDFDHQLLPDDITLPFLWVGLALNVTGLFTDLTSAVVGAMAGYLSLWLVFHGFRLLTGKEGMGYGDFKLLAVFGAWLGWKALPAVILISSVVGAVVGVALILARGHDRNVPIPFGPYLAAAGWITLLWGDALMNWYLSGPF
jgi:leader peptidase (prepilin peptidase)/N-methyltransferase